MRAHDVLQQNVRACQSVAQVIESTLGPAGAHKLLVTAAGDDRDAHLKLVSCTNDGASILRLLSLEHAAARLMVELASAQDASLGDGTTSVVLLAASLLQHALVLVSRDGVAVRNVVAAYRIACECVVEFASSHAFAAPDDAPASRRAWLQSLAATCLSSKLNPLLQQQSTPTRATLPAEERDGSGVVQHFASTTVSAVLYALGTAPEDGNQASSTTPLRRRVVIEKHLGVLEDTRAVCGIVLPAHQALAPRSLDSVPVLLVSALPQICGVTQRQSRVWASEQRVTSLEQAEALATSELGGITAACQSIIDTGCKVLLAKALLHPCAIKYVALSLVRSFVHRSYSRYSRYSILTQAGVSCLHLLSNEQLEMASRVCRAPILSSLEPPIPACGVGSLAPLPLAEEVVWLVTGPHGGGSTVIVRAHSQAAADECEQSLHDALCIVSRCVAPSSRFVGGAGALYVAGAKHLRCQARNATPALVAPLLAFADALESIPLTLARNGALFESERETRECRAFLWILMLSVWQLGWRHTPYWRH